MNQKYINLIPAILFSFLVPIFYIILVFKEPTIIMPTFTNPSDVEYLIQSGHEYSLFYSVLIFTCIAGSIELLEKTRTFLIKILYYSLNFILTFSIWRTLMIYSENINLENLSILGDISLYMANWHSSPFVNWLSDPIFRTIIVSITFIFFTFLFEKYSK